eukprot:7610008-Pyramimonas_sp.AAC.1
MCNWCRLSPSSVHDDTAQVTTGRARRPKDSDSGTKPPKGDGVDVRGDCVDVRGYHGVDVRGDGVDIRGDGVDVRGDGVDVRDDGVDLSLIHI